MSQPNHAITTTTPDESDHDDLGVAVVRLVREIEELHPLWHLESASEHLGDVAAALDRLATATAMSVIAQYGSGGDRSAAVTYLKRRFEGA